MVIFKRKTQPKDKFPPGVVVHHHPKGWMDVEGMNLWIKKVWSSRPGGLLRHKPEQESKNGDSEDEDLYDDQWRSLFGESNDEDEFEGFWCAGVRAKKTNGSFRSHKFRKKSMLNDKNVSVYFSLSTSTQTTY